MRAHWLWKEGGSSGATPNFGRYPLALDAPPEQARFSQLRAPGRKCGAAMPTGLKCRSSSSLPSLTSTGASIASKGVDMPLGPRRRHQASALEAGQGDFAARADRRQDRLRQIDAVARADHERGPALQPRPGRALPDRLQERCRIQDLRRDELAACPGHRRRERTRVRPERARSAWMSSSSERGEIFRSAGVKTWPAIAQAAAMCRCRASCWSWTSFRSFSSKTIRSPKRSTLLLDRLVRQGRAFGMHVILGSQTLGGAVFAAQGHSGPDGGANRTPVQ